MPHQAPLLQLHLALDGRSLTSAAPRAPLGDGALLLAVLLAPTPTQRRQRQITREATAAVPHRPRPTLARARQPHRVTDHRARPARAEPGAGVHPLLAQPRDELTLSAARAGACTDHSLESLSAGALGVLAALPDPDAAAVVSGDLARLQPAAARTPPAGLKLPQPELALQQPGGLLGALALEVHAGLAAVLGHQTDHQVHVIRPARRLAVTHRHPPALRPRSLAREPHLGDEPLRDLAPPLVRQRRLVGVQRQRGVPHV